MPKSKTRRSYPEVRHDLEARGLLVGVLEVLRAQRSTLQEICTADKGKTASRGRRAVYAYLRGGERGMSTPDIGKIFGLHYSTVLGAEKTQVAMRPLAKTALERPTLGEEVTPDEENPEAGWLVELRAKRESLLALARGVRDGRPILSYVESAHRMSAIVLELLGEQ